MNAPVVHNRATLVPPFTGLRLILSSVGRNTHCGVARRFRRADDETDEAMTMNETYVTISGNMVVRQTHRSIRLC